MKKFTVSILAAILSLTVAGLSFAAETAPAPTDPSAPVTKTDQPVKKHHKKHAKKHSKKAVKKDSATEAAPAAPAAN